MNFARLCTTVLHDNSLSDGAVRLFAVIHSLYPNCFAFDQYFADLLGWSKSKVQRKISELKKAGYIMTVVVYGDDQKTIKSRRIRVASAVTVQAGTGDITLPAEMTVPTRKNDGTLPAEMTVPTRTDEGDNTIILIQEKPSTTARAESFAMHLDWQPPDSLSDHLKQSGIQLDKIHETVRNEIRGEFISFWMSREHVLRESEWLHKLRAAFIRARERGNLYDQPARVDLSAGNQKTKPLRLRDISIDEQLTDRSWAN